MFSQAPLLRVAHLARDPSNRLGESDLGTQPGPEITPLSDDYAVSNGESQRWLRPYDAGLLRLRLIPHRGAISDLGRVRACSPSSTKCGGLDAFSFYAARGYGSLILSTAPAWRVI